MASLIASFAKVGGGTLSSRMLGFVRDLTIARVFGADAASDAFFVAFKIPNFARRLFAEGALSMALVPVLNEHRQRQGLPALKSFVDDLTGTLAAALLLITGLGILAAPLLILVFAPGFGADTDQLALATTLLRLTLPYVFFVTLTALAAAVLNTYERFGVPAFTPALLNIVLISCALWLAPLLEMPILALAWGVLVAGLVQLVFQLPFLAQIGLLPRPRFKPRDPGVILVFRRLGPGVLGVSVGQISLLLDTLLASVLVTGSISWLYYSDRLMELPLGLLGVALGTVILPRLSQREAAQDPERFSETLDWALRWALLLGLPAAVGLLVLAEPVMATLFLSSEFGAEDVTRAAHSLMAYALGIPAFLAIKVLVPGYYARQDVRTPVRLALIALGVGLVVHLLVMVPMGHAGLALATALTAALNAVLLLRGLKRSGIYRRHPGWARLLGQTSLASLSMGLILHWGVGARSDWLQTNTWTQVLDLTGWILAGGLVYLMLLLITGLRPGDLSECV
ncbi:murein biosynthesis integral membrane protein MurJ [Thermochromatium tepidum]|uniref:Probable lipid II flippase MurJ n=1 Tax=Thermochromatium tepidum ATCC 43061 TaxID=316276 RepID=A0A6I6E0Y4_THETI|nr:murein biosynthesis integral membrane protein MurJ [Thermochromatium tepidum]QGU33581.1 murein biosynthesis integral membrane protein MurJ [Thermochromatium tepidum ATCC 43061]